MMQVIKHGFQTCSHQARYFTTRSHFSFLSHVNSASIQLQSRDSRIHLASTFAKAFAPKSPTVQPLRVNASTATAEQEGSEVDVDIIIEGQPLKGDGYVIIQACPIT